MARESHEDVVGAQISIARLLDQIPAGQAEAIRLVKIDGLSIAEACAQIGPVRTAGQSEYPSRSETVDRAY